LPCLSVKIKSRERSFPKLSLAVYNYAAISVGTPSTSTRSPSLTKYTFGIFRKFIFYYQIKN
jgi:hypothetical protein